MYKALFFLSFFFGLITTDSFCGLPDETVYLTWQQKPETSMTIQWLSFTNDAQTVVWFRNVDEEQWTEKKGKWNFLPGTQDYFIHSIELQDLKPKNIYQFTINQNQKIYTFHTMPETLNSSIRFVEGGDMFHDDLLYVCKTCQEAAKQSPDFALLGGDLAYSVASAKSPTENIERWVQWIKNWHATMISPQGHLIPVLSAIGNHDLIGHFDQTPKQAELFKTFFPSTTQTIYRVLDFSSYLSLFLLDSGHAHPIAGEQTTWLKSELAKRSSSLHRLAVYHVPAYPSVRSFYNRQSKAIRQFWVPLFEQGEIQLAFEHHDHAYKRTYALLKGKIHPKGIIYLGDGGWGVKNMRQPRQRRPSRMLMAKTLSNRHFILVTLNQNEQIIQTISDQGQLIDQLIHPLKIKESIFKK